MYGLNRMYMSSLNWKLSTRAPGVMVVVSMLTRHRPTKALAGIWTWKVMLNPSCWCIRISHFCGARVNSRWFWRNGKTTRVPLVTCGVGPTHKKICINSLWLEMYECKKIRRKLYRSWSRRAWYHDVGRSCDPSCGLQWRNSVHDEERQFGTSAVGIQKCDRKRDQCKPEIQLESLIVFNWALRLLQLKL